MKTHTKTLIAALGALVMSAAPAAANAERVYFLVGTRHVYRIGTFEYAHVEERQKIEQDYADQVAADQEQFNKAVADGADPNAEGQNLNAALDDLAEERDKELGALYERVDWERERHPELQIEGDGPYQVMGINFHWRGAVEVFDNFYVYRPWPGYIVEGNPYGWNYGVVYSPYEFHHVYTTWYGGYISLGRPAFVGIYGSSGPVVYNIHVEGGSRYVFERRHVERREGFERSAYFRGGGRLSERKIDRGPERGSGNGVGRGGSANGSGNRNRYSNGGNSNSTTGGNRGHNVSGQRGNTPPAGNGGLLNPTAPRNGGTTGTSRGRYSGNGTGGGYRGGSGSTTPTGGGYRGGSGSTTPTGGGYRGGTGSTPRTTPPAPTRTAPPARTTPPPSAPRSAPPAPRKKG